MLASFASPATHSPASMSFLPLSHSTTSLSTTHSGCFTEASDSTGYTSDGRRDSRHCVKGNPEGVCGGDECAIAGEQDNEMERFLLGPGWHDHRVPPAERLKHLYRLLEEHYDLTGGDYDGQHSFHICRTTGGSKKATQPKEYLTACIPYLASIGVNIGFLEGSGEISSDPMKDLIDEAFRLPVSPSFGRGPEPVSTWEIDWNRPLPQATRVYWETMQRTRPKPVHEFIRTKPVVGDPRVVHRPFCRQEDFPQYFNFESSAHNTSGFRAVFHKVLGLVSSH